ncbi:MAG: N-acyl homoserine lactonase family protein [Robiginitomaculum sp.]|nr:N-acyl homoserine lactonase family protein [Robiginitomaculum sp.]
MFIFRLLFVLMMTSLISGCGGKPVKKPIVRLFALDCGSIEVTDMSPFSINGAFDGQSYSLANPCYLIRHPDGDLLWDTGFDQALADSPDGMRGGGFHSTVSVKLTDQLQEIGLNVDDIEYVSVSHSHPDHIGNARLFKKSTFLISSLEFSYMFSDEMRKSNESFDSYAHLESTLIKKYNDEYDVFGDGLVVIKTLPGHTPGSSILVLHLENAGTVLLTGDLIIHAAGRRIGAVPTFNTDAAQTRDSLAKFESLAAQKSALVIIQHEPMDFKKLPAFPEWLD